MPRVRALVGPGLVMAAAMLVLGLATATLADPGPTPTTTPVATTTTTATTAATTTTATTPTTTAATTTTATATTTTPTTTAAATTTTATTTPAAETLEAVSTPASGCSPVGAAALLPPHSRPVVLTPQGQLSAAQIAYPSDGSILSAAGVTLGSSCTGSRSSGGTARLSGVSMFGGAVTASSVTVSLSGGEPSVSGLAVNGTPVTLAPGHTINLGTWGFLIAPDPSAASHAAFEIELATDYAGLPAGTLVFVPYARIETAPPPVTTAATTTTATPPTTTRATKPKAAPPATTTTTPSPAATAPSAQHDENFNRPAPAPWRHPKVEHEPLTVTPPLHAGPYVFPVAGDPEFGDSYGGVRTDVSGGWHHGDDIFAPLGTPVVAVADGTLNRVGWERLGGWRLWVRDRAGDEFYYAHLSGYSPLALEQGAVKRGEVIGFVGNTGDAFTTVPHLHFEIHPRSLLYLQYDGAVDPTRYLQAWEHPGKLDVPRPVHPLLPLAADWRHEAAVNFTELLAARGLEHHQASPAPVPLGFTRPRVRAPDPVVVAAAATPLGRASSSTAAWASAYAGMALLALGFVYWLARRPE
jgi:murein DD-endopeptidase MepM/ murein hydrolase activator NlpD